MPISAQAIGLTPSDAINGGERRRNDAATDPGRPDVTLRREVSHRQTDAGTPRPFRHDDPQSDRTSQSGDVHDTIALDLAERMADRSHVSAGQVLVTGPGELQESHQVRRILHVAAVEGEPGSGYRQVMALERCVRNILGEVNRLADSGEALRSVVLPLLRTGGGNSDLHKTVDTLLATTVSYFRLHAASRIRVVYLLAYTDVQAAICKAALNTVEELSSDG
ncbi:hypothetical protein [Streptomyces sp. NPDC046862]|uniref:hypothetical protein n=1 Tax=Streptomyces sp. NPDC046862 TaxID=3154603 RepID=UPI0034517A73